MERERFIRVPKDERAMKDYDYGIQKKTNGRNNIIRSPI